MIPLTILIPVLIFMATRLTSFGSVSPSFHLDRWFRFSQQITGYCFFTYFLVDVLFDIHDVMCEVFAGKTNGKTTGTGASSTADTVYVVFT